MNEEMLKSLTSLIDESLAELEELKKSDRFSASEIKLDGPGSGIAGKDPQGSLGKEEDEKKEDEDEEDEEEHEKGMDKAEECAKDEDEEEEEEDDKEDLNKSVYSAQHDPENSSETRHSFKVFKDGVHVGSANGWANRGGNENYLEDGDLTAETAKKIPRSHHGKAMKAVQAASRKMTGLKKSNDELLLKSYVDSRFEAFESKIDRITNLVQSLASSPVPSKSVGYKTLAPLAKSQDETAPLSKSEIMDRLMDLKKSNPRSVDSADIAGAEMSSGHALAKIANKYNIK